ncbi:hypothetical protein HaLaN_08253, partial [Haematococcus lacustris]
MMAGAAYHVWSRQPIVQAMVRPSTSGSGVYYHADTDISTFSLRTFSLLFPTGKVEQGVPQRATCEAGGGIAKGVMGTLPPGVPNVAAILRHGGTQQGQDQGLQEWRSIQDTVTLTFKAFFDALKSQTHTHAGQACMQMCLHGRSRAPPCTSSSRLVQPFEAAG